MSTIFLRFADRVEALSVLGEALGFDGTQDGDGRQINSSGISGGQRYHLCFLADAGVTTGGGGDHVNLLWIDEPIGAPDLSAYVVTPMSPSCVFQVA